MPSVAPTLHDIASTLESSDGAEERIRHVLGLLRQIVRYGQCAVLEVRQGIEDRLVAVPELPQAEGGALRDALRPLFSRLSEGTVLQRGDLLSGVPRWPHWNSRLAVPLVGVDEVIGLLFVAQAADGKYTERDLSIVSLVGAQLAAYITALREQADLLAAKQTIQELRDLQGLADAALLHTHVDELLADLLERVRDRLNADAVAVLFPSEDGLYMAERASLGLPRGLEPLRLPMPPELRQVVTSQEAVSFEDLASLETIAASTRASMPSLLGTPLLSGERLIGLLLAGSRQPGRFTEHDARLLRLIGERIAVPLEHARLYEEEQLVRKRAEAVQRRLALLAEVTTALIAALDYEGALQSIARLMVPVLGDLCAVDIADADGELRQVALANQEPTREDEIRRARVRHRVKLNSAHPIADALRSGRPQVYGAVPDLLLRSLGVRPTGAPRTHEIESAMIVPLVARGRPLGAITYASATADRFQDDDVSLAEQVGRRVAFAVDNGRLYRVAQAAEARYRRLLSKRIRSMPRSTRLTAGDLDQQPEAESPREEGALSPRDDVVESWLENLPPATLTGRELDVLQSLVAGASTREIARRLVVSEHAVRYHLRNLFLKLEVHSRTQLVAHALQLGLARTPDSL